MKKRWIKGKVREISFLAVCFFSLQLILSSSDWLPFQSPLNWNQILLQDTIVFTDHTAHKALVNEFLKLCDMSFLIRVDAESLCISLRHQGRASPIRVLRRSHSEVVVTRWRRRQSHDARCQSDSAIAMTRWERRRPADAGSKCLGCKEDKEHRRHCEQECVLELNRGNFEKENVDDNGNDDRCVVKTTTGHSPSVFDKLVCILKNSNLIFSSPSSRGAEVMFTLTTRDDKEKGVTWTSKTGKGEKINVVSKATFDISKTKVKEKKLRINLKRDSVDFCREETTPGDGECRGSQDGRVTDRGMNGVVSASVFSETFKRSTDVDVMWVLSLNCVRSGNRSINHNRSYRSIINHHYRS